MNSREIEEGLLDYEVEEQERKTIKAADDAYTAIIRRDIEEVKREIERKELEEREKAIYRETRETSDCEEGLTKESESVDWYDDYKYDDFDDWYDDGYDDGY